MSGHSKWAQIKRQKGVADTKRGQAFTKLANAITIAVRSGGGVSDPNQNFRLRLAIEKARSLNMPKENITRAIEKGLGIGKGEGIDEVVYEGFAPGGAMVIVEAATDNKMRTTSEIKNFFEKSGGIFGQPGSVSYQFENKGLIIIPITSGSMDDIFLLAADASAQDIEQVGEQIHVYTSPNLLAKVKDAISAKNVTILEAEIIRKPKTTILLEDKEKAEKIMAFLDTLEAMDDVQKVYTNVVLSNDLQL